MRLGYTDRARDDLELAFSLGFDFLDCVEAALQNIIETPKMYQIRYSNFRGCVIRRFPFSIFYTLESEKIVVHSIFDNRQNFKKRP